MCCNLFIGNNRWGPAPLPPDSLNSWVFTASSHPSRNVPCPIYVLVGNTGTTSPTSKVRLYYFPPGTAVLAASAHFISDSFSNYPTWLVPGGSTSWPGYAYLPFVWDVPPYGNTNVTLMAQVENVGTSPGCAQQFPSGTPTCDPRSGVRSIFFHEV
jgi:hypothetical protein